MRKKQLLRQEATPTSSTAGMSGVRRLNNNPKFIVAGVIGCFVAIVAYSASQQPSAMVPEEAEEPKVVNSASSNHAKAIVGERRFGIVQAEEPHTIAGPKPDKKAPVEIKPPRSLAEVERMLGQGPEKSSWPKMTEARGTPTSVTSTPPSSASFDPELLQKAKQAPTTVALFPNHQVHPNDRRRHRADSNRQANDESKPGAMDVVRSQMAEAAALTQQLSSVGQEPAKHNAGDSYSNFKASSENRWALPSKLRSPDSEYMLLAGHVIPGTLISGINSSIPGPIISQVSRPVFDTVTGQHLLIPQGAKIFGEYENKVIFGQKRVLVAWQRIQLPSGKTIDIGAMPGTSGSGSAGFQDKTDAHLIRTLGSAVLMSAITAGVTVTQNPMGAGRRQERDAAQTLSAALGQQLGQASMKLLEKNLNVAPTLRIRPGFEFNIIVTKDIRLSPIGY